MENTSFISRHNGRFLEEGIASSQKDMCCNGAEKSDGTSVSR